jgi:hypothetical protein
MKIESPIALNFIMQEELYFLNKDKNLYNNAPAMPAPVAAVVPDEFSFRGSKKGNFLILVHYHDQEFIAEAHLTALDNILKRKGFETDGVAILNMAKHNHADFESISAYFHPKKILFLGENALPKGIAPLQLNQPRQLDGCEVLYSFSFDEMMDSNDHKKAFWEQMKLL